VATSPDPDDPEASIQAEERERDQHRIVDERLDPYSGRFFPKEPRTERLAGILRQEWGVEKVVRSRTWAVIQERCGTNSEDWQQALEAWKREQLGEDKG
jgi:hypothetical protein